MPNIKLTPEQFQNASKQAIDILYDHLSQYLSGNKDILSFHEIWDKAPLYMPDMRRIFVWDCHVYLNEMETHAQLSAYPLREKDESGEIDPYDNYDHSCCCFDISVSLPDHLIFRLRSNRDESGEIDPDDN